ncbi:MAG: transporter substrate-binding domain-containing protein, partial [Mesorhizobium sp.]
MFYSSKPTAFMCAVMCGALLGYLTTSASADGVKTPERIKSAGKIVFCTDVGFPPWEMYDPNTQQPTGFDVDMAAAVSKEMGVKSEHKNIGFDGLIPALLANQCDAIISGFYDKPERAK